MKIQYIVSSIFGGLLLLALALAQSDFASEQSFSFTPIVTDDGATESLFVETHNEETTPVEVVESSSEVSITTETDVDSSSSVDLDISVDSDSASVVTDVSGGLIQQPDTTIDVGTGLITCQPGDNWRSDDRSVRCENDGEDLDFKIRKNDNSSSVDFKIEVNQ